MDKKSSKVLHHYVKLFQRDTQCDGFPPESKCIIAPLVLVLSKGTAIS